jgi:hypothetical protein
MFYKEHPEMLPPPTAEQPVLTPVDRALKLFKGKKK